VYIAWGQRNRSAYIRVPRYQPGKENATRIELRSPDPSCNIYLAFAVMLAAGAEGIRKKYDLVDPVEENIYLPPAVEENIYEMSNHRQKKFKIHTLPRNLEEAVKLAEKSDIVRETLGLHIFSKFISNKQAEIAEYAKNVGSEFDKQVSDFEIRHYLPFL
jgi:glutamine synthetase